jgi:Na+-transporting methylmalonyl-CoA/oxaloacetate decarboxylase gamma subunit
MTSPQQVYEVRPRKHKRGVDLISDALPLVFKILFLLALVLSGISFALAQAMHSSPAPQPNWKELALYAPPPTYPIDARRSHAEGKGIVVMEIDEKTGRVKSAKWKKALVINSWMTLLFKHSVIGDSSPALFADSVLL